MSFIQMLTLRCHNFPLCMPQVFAFTFAAFLIIAEDTTFFGFSDGWFYNGTKWWYAGTTVLLFMMNAVDLFTCALNACTLSTHSQFLHLCGA